MCSRNGSSWFRFFDPRPLPASCTDYTDPYAVPLGDVQLLVLDSALADDKTAPEDQVTTYTSQFASLQSMAAGKAWLVTHHPLWGVSQDKEKDGTDKIVTRNATLQAASRKKPLPAGVQLVLSGHIHFFQWLSFSGGRPPQLIVGNSGTELIPPITASLAGVTIDGTPVASGATVHRFGYLGVEPSGSGWTATLYDPAGATLTTCTLQDLAASCSP